MDSGPAISAEDITPHDTNAIPVTRGIYVGTGGNLKVTLQCGGTVTFTNVADCTLLPICAVKVFATLTTATGLIALR